MAQGVADTEMIRRQNRQLVLDALRRHGPLSRSQVASTIGLSNATLTAIAAELVGDGILTELAELVIGAKSRGRPGVRLAHNRDAGFVLLIEIDVNRCRLSLIDYSGVLVDRVETTVDPALFARTPPAVYFVERIGMMIGRNADIANAIHAVSISVQGILDSAGASLKWSPIAHLAGHDIIGPIHRRLGLSAQLFKRGRLMADGMRWLDPTLDSGTVATIHIGSTIGMGLTFPNGRPETDLGTEFGHMVHVPGGALCRCGARGCIESYAADYAILRAAYSVPEQATPASSVPAADFQQLAMRARQGERNARRAFTSAGQAIGYGINRLISIIEIDRIVLLGPTTAAYDLIEPGIAEGATASLMGKIRGLPPITRVADAGEPIYRGLMMKTLTEIDQAFASRVVAPPVRRSAE
ncbi:ROK family transcriptional regulator [Pelagibacterium sp. 26DY04]|uniref:ROK family transcriptional regulator n=1 Tax=Pelagibacterium sp. 26DY04 TaxID=2967130 RepID=UPI0028155758|nr:ROK family transcriptional regulator [Pelagibacterium sp. 26DY04]WMT85546.1 ROK family transcriptional regulator [Pelagibacterium sp. 26DY04]